MSVFTPCGHRQLTRTPRSPYVIDSHSANATAARFVTVYGADPICGKQPGGGRSRAEVAVAASEPLVEEVLGGPPVRVDVDVERELPVLLGGRQVDAATDPGVGEEQVDRPERLLGGADQLDVARPRWTRRRSHRPLARVAAVVPAGSSTSADDHVRAAVVEAAGERCADAPSGSGDHHVGAVEIHHASVGRRPHSGRTQRAGDRSSRTSAEM